MPAYDPAKALKTLEPHAKRIAATNMRAMFEADPKRFSRYSLKLDDLLFDYSKNRIDDKALAALVDLARKAGVEARRDAMFAGGKINTTEGRAVLHTALRNRSKEPVILDGHDLGQTPAATVLAGILHGIDNRIDPGPETTGNAYDEAADGPAMPRDWGAAIAAAQQSAFLKKALGEDMHRTFTAVKAAEYARVARTISEVDFDLYLHTV